MKKIILVLAIMVSSLGQAKEIKLSQDCVKEISDSLMKDYSLDLSRIKNASYWSGGSDGASSWDDEYSALGIAKDNKGVVRDFLIYFNSSYDCSVYKVRAIN